MPVCKLRYVLFSLFLLLFTDMVHAKEQTRFTRYLKSNYYEKSIYDAAGAYGLQHYSCDIPNLRVVRLKPHMLIDVIFEKGKAHPISGAWFEKVQVLVCGRAVMVDVSVIANKGKAPDFLAAPAREP